MDADLKRKLERTWDSQLAHNNNNTSSLHVNPTIVSENIHEQRQQNKKRQRNQLNETHKAKSMHIKSMDIYILLE